MGTRICLLLLAAAAAYAELLTPVWVELGEHGQPLARVVVAAPADCPAIQLDGASQPMQVRSPVPDKFRPLCELAIPAGTRKAQVSGQKLALSRPNPSKIVAFGDTGCRIEGTRLQNCNTPAEWPFEQVAKAAAERRPDLMIHVGDYLYREDACPAGKEAMCGGTPHGDNWDTWNADFFKPGAKLLAAVPWILARGNHEVCGRAGIGWSYYLDVHPWTGTCQDTSSPVLVELGSFRVVLFDSSAWNDNRATPELIETYRKQLAGISTEHAWLLDHHPFWAFKGAAKGHPLPPKPRDWNRPGTMRSPRGSTWSSPATPTHSKF